MTAHPILSLVERWRERADDPFVPDPVRRAVEACAEDVAGWTRVELTVAEAALETGRSESTVRRWIDAGRIPKVRGSAVLRVRRCDLCGVTDDSEAERIATRLVAGRIG